MAGLLLRQPVADCGGEYQGDPLVLGDAYLVGFSLDQGEHVLGEANGGGGSLCLLGHSGDGSACATGTVVSYVPSSKQGSRRANVQPSYSRESAL